MDEAASGRDSKTDLAAGDRTDDRGASTQKNWTNTQPPGARRSRGPIVAAGAVLAVGLGAMGGWRYSVGARHDPAAHPRPTSATMPAASPSTSPSIADSFAPTPTAPGEGEPPPATTSPLPDAPRRSGSSPTASPLASASPRPTPAGPSRPAPPPKPSTSPSVLERSD